MSGFIVAYTTNNNGHVKMDGQQIAYWAGTGPATFRGTLDEFATTYPTVVEEMVQRLIIRPR